MLFSSITFLFNFLPLLILIYFIVPQKAKNAVLLAASMLFYAWGEPVYLFLMLGAVASAYVFGLFIDKFRGKKASKVCMILSLAVNLSLLVLFKYSDFFISNINSIFRSNIALLGIALPIGISFYTFQIMSYTIDLYRGETKVQKNFFSFAMYVSFFPQLIAGPIVRYVTIENEIYGRKVTLDDFAYGIGRFIIGLAKKTLLANVLGEFCELYKAAESPTVLFAWTYIICYTFHIYFDFSGYSDMAIGLGRMFGFRFLENFNYPYISKSVTEFWRRWHISLSTFFRDYVYIPLGGNRVSKPRWFFNILVVWMLTGFWHGAEWTFILWGLWFAILLILEKFVLKKVLDKLPSVFSWLYSMLMIMFGWLLFDAPNLSVLSVRAGQLFGTVPLADANSVYYLKSYAVVIIAAFIGATPLPAKIAAKLKEKRALSSVMTVLEPIFYTVLFVLICAYLIDGSFNPFIYFRF